MNITHIIGTLNTGGIQKYLLQLINSSKLNNYKHQVLCAISSEGNYRSEYEANRIDFIYFPFTYLPCSKLPYKIDKFLRNLYSKLFMIRFYLYLIRTDTEIIHSHIHINILSQMIASIIAGKKFVWTIHGEYELPKFTQILVRIFHSIISSTRLIIIGDSRYALEGTLPYIQNQKNSKGIIISTGIDLDIFVNKRNSLDIRIKYKIPPNTILIGSTGRIVWQKGYDQLISLLNNFHFSQKQIHFIIAGDGSLKNHYIKAIKESGISDQISFVGNIKDVPEFLLALDIYIQPSITEGFPLSVLEAMAAGLPVICSDAGGLKEMIQNLENGIIYKSQNINDLYENLCLVLSMTSDRLGRLSKNAIKTVQNKYSINHSAKQYEIIYKKK